MLHNLKSAFRYLNRNRIATAINVTGLAVALSAAFLMLQYLDFELSYDTYLPEHNDVYRITTQQSENGGPTILADPLTCLKANKVSTASSMWQRFEWLRIQDGAIVALELFVGPVSPSGISLFANRSQCVKA